nr:autotransporter-associated beta strand repeat-containing protein [uncultured Carboxylicivirga sp.]
MKKFYTYFCTALLWIILPFLSNAQRQIENLDRGVVAVRTSTSEVFISWRWLGTEDENISFNIYRDDTKINTTPVTQTTNFIDNSSAVAQYSVAAVINNVEQAKSTPVDIWDNQYLEVNLNRPSGGTTPDGVSYTYSPNDCSVGDLDGDGQYEIIVKWDPSNSKDNSQSGYTGNVFLDAYKFDGTQLWRIDLGINIRAGAHYTQFLVYDFDGDGIAELACKTAPGTKDNSGNFINTGPAASADHSADYRNTGGYILSGPEYLTVFSGVNGYEMATVYYTPARGSVSSWGDSYGNRVDRFLACVAYLDGEHPSLVMTRGYYTRSVLSAWDWDGTELTQRWIFDSNDSGNSAYYGQGNHNLSVGDVDQDGKDEIIYGSCTINDDGTGLYSTGLGHGDALHVSDMDPDRPGLEVFMPHEEAGNGMTYRDAATGEVLWQIKAPGEDVGRGVAGDISPDHRGYERWSSTGDGAYSIDGELIGGKTAMNFLIWWDDDLTRELLDGTNISKYNVGTLLTAFNCSSNNSTKATPNLSGDILGDWREEVIFRTTDNTKLRIYTTTNETSYRFRTLMHDPQYRLAIAWQNVGYNQPPHPGFFLGTDMDTPPLAPIAQAKLKWDGSAGFSWDVNTSSNWKLANGTTSVFNNDDDVIFSISGNNSSDVLINETISPSKVTVINPNDYTFSGTGGLSGSMDLIKSGAGSLVINTTNNYTGKTLVSEGLLQINGNIATSETTIEGKGEITGNGTTGSLNLLSGSKIWVGDYNQASSTHVNGNLLASNNTSFEFDLSDDPTGTTKSNDQIIIDGDLSLGENISFNVNKPDGTLSDGTYTLLTFTGSFTGSLDNISLSGIRELVTSIELSGQSVVLVTTLVRDPASILWDGTTNNSWDYLNNTNWLNNGVSDFFAYGDYVLFDDSGNTTVNVADDVPIGGMEVSASTTYKFTGTGTISGTGGLLKSGTGYLIMNEANTFTGNVELRAGLTSVTNLSNIGSPGSFGSGSNDPASIYLNGGSIYYTGDQSTTNRGITVGESNGDFYTVGSSEVSLDGVITGTGNFTKRGTGKLNLSAANTISGPVTLTEGTIGLTSENANSYGLGTDKVIIKDATLNMFNSSGSYSNIYWNLEVPAGYTATINMDGRCDHYGAATGEGTLELVLPFSRVHLNGDWSAYAGQINTTASPVSVYGNWFVVGNSIGYPNASIDLGDGVFAVYKNSSDATIEIGELTGSNSSVLGSGGQGANTITWRIGGKRTSVAFDGKITNDQYKNTGSQSAIIKTGSGRWTLTNANTYTGGTVIEQGTIIAANTSGSATGTGPVTVYTNSSLAGTGYVSGDVTVNNRAYIMPGISPAYGNLTINNNLTFLTGARLYIKTDAAAGICDKVTVNGTYTVAGTLYMVLNNGSFANGQSYQVLDASSISGSFDAISPSAPGDGLYWDTSELYTNGIIKVTNVATAITPVEANDNIRVYPNPVEDLLYIEVMDNNVPSKIEIRDVSGRTIKQLVGNNGSNYKIDFSYHNKGIYFVIITVNEQLLIKKIVKE